MKPFFTLLFAILSITTAFSQTTEMTGRVVDAATGEGLAYASVSIYHRPEATYTNTDGSFSLKVPTNRISDTAYISSVGYPGTTVLLRNINHPVIKLTKMVYPIDEVAVTAKRKKRKTIVINPISPQYNYYNTANLLYSNDDVLANNTVVSHRLNHFSLVYVPYDSLYKQYKYVKEITILQFLQGIDPSKDSEDVISKWRGSTDDWKLRIRILKAEPNPQQAELDDRPNNHPGDDILCDNVIATKNNATYDYDMDVETRNKVATMNAFEKSEYIRKTHINSLGTIKVNLEKYKIVVPKTGLYYGIEYLGPPQSRFWINRDSSNDLYIDWIYANGSWHTYYNNNKANGIHGKLPLSLTLSE
jgi:hypothetical protein